MPVKVMVTYCGGWGYRPKYENLRQDLVSEFGDKIEVASHGTQEITGYLEVEVNGKLIHSKKGGDGYIDRKDKVQKIINAIKEALNA